MKRHFLGHGKVSLAKFFFQSIKFSEIGGKYFIVVGGIDAPVHYVALHHMIYSCQMALKRIMFKASLIESFRCCLTSSPFQRAVQIGRRYLMIFLTNFTPPVTNL